MQYVSKFNEFLLYTVNRTRKGYPKMALNEFEDEEFEDFDEEDEEGYEDFDSEEVVEDNSDDGFEDFDDIDEEETESSEEEEVTEDSSDDGFEDFNDEDSEEVTEDSSDDGFEDFDDEDSEEETESSGEEEEPEDNSDDGFEDFDDTEDNSVEAEDTDEEGDNEPSGVAAMSPEMQAEYDATFSDEEKAANLLKITSDKFTRSKQVIKISEIGFTEPTKMGRQRTMTGLTQSVKELGVVTPIHVMKVADEDASDDYKYILIDGLRRIFGAMKNGITEIDAVVWDFKDKERGMELLLPLGLMLNRTQKRSWKEIWDLYRVLEMQSAITPGTLEFLLQLEAGDAMKLKDVMLCEYSEVKEALLNEEKNLDGCYKMLQKLRKEEDQLSKDDATGISDTVENSEEIATDTTEGKEQLSDQDVLELLEMADSMDTEESLNSEDFNSMNKTDDSFVDQQKVGERHPLDPALRQAVLARDDFTCKCCGLRMVGARLGLIAVHHIIPVSCKGKDELSNLTTLCVNCHLSLHIMQRQGGSIMMSEEDFKNLTPNEQTSLKRSLKLARIAIEAGKRLGKTKEQVLAETKDVIRHPMPGAGMKENEIAYSYAKAHPEQKPEDEDDEEFE